MQAPAVLATVKATDVVGPDQKAGCLENAQSQGRNASPSGFSVACHRQVLVLLFQDVVLWLVETEQIKAFRPRRN
jgi:hypothetical protein